jgi:hypothetical protein
VRKAHTRSEAGRARGNLSLEGDEGPQLRRHSPTDAYPPGARPHHGSSTVRPWLELSPLSKEMRPLSEPGSCPGQIWVGFRRDSDGHTAPEVHAPRFTTDRPLSSEVKRLRPVRRTEVLRNG